jgi:hypothetical protein
MLLPSQAHASEVEDTYISQRRLVRKADPYGRILSFID